MDLFRHVGRGELTSFAGGAVANRQLEQTFWAAAPYTEQDLQNQVTAIANSGPHGAQAMQDINTYLAGINAYITQAYNSRTFPGEYDLTGHINPITNAGSIPPFTPDRPDRDRRASSARCSAAAVAARCSPHWSRRPRTRSTATPSATRCGSSFREENDPEADLTLHDGQSLPVLGQPEQPAGRRHAGPGLGDPAAGGLRPDRLGGHRRQRRKKDGAAEPRSRARASSTTACCRATCCRRSTACPTPWSSPGSTPMTATRSPCSARRPVTSRHNC